VRYSRVFVVPAVAGAVLAGAGTATAGPPGSPHRARVASPKAAHAISGDLQRAASGSQRLGVVLKPGARADGALSSARAEGASLAHRLDGLHYLSLSVPSAAATRVAAALAHRPDVERVEVVPTRHASADPNDPYYGNQQTYRTAVGAPSAWGVTHGSAAIKVAVIDTGVEIGHPDLTGKIAGAHNSMATAPAPDDVTDDVGHGTHVAGIIGAATGNGTGVAGAGYDTSVLAVKAGDDTGFTDDDISAGIQWAVTNGARVINMSLGGPSTSTVLSNAVAYAEQQGVLVVAAAANHDSSQPYTSTPMYPAALPGVIAVGATDAIGHRADFSDYGSWVTVAAPGTGVWSTVPTLGSLDFPGATSGYAPADGTSMASPIVAAEAALLMGRQPYATASQVRSAVVGSASGYSGLGLGAGQVDFLAAFDRMPPSTVPSLTSPAPGAFVGGAVGLTASSSSTAPDATVRFLVDGAAVGTPVALSTGSATTSWESWGTTEGTHQLTAQDCDSFGCGQASAPVSVTVQNTAPTITAPTDGSTVSDTTDVTATTSDGAPKVRLTVDGVVVGAPVAVSAGTAHLAWGTAGYANGAHAVSVAACTSAGACGVSSSVSANVTNTAPVVTSPKVGQLVSGSFTLGATASSGAVQFLVDDKQVGFDASAPYSVVVNFSAFTDGSHTLKVQPCTVTKSVCAGPAASRTISVKSLHPSITKAAPATFSPNGDKRADTTTLTYYLPDTESVWWGVKNGSGTIVRGPTYLGTLAKGSHSFVWNGYGSNGLRAANGTYSTYVTTRVITSAATLYGQANRGVRLDTVAPTLSTSGLASGFYPYTDGYRDTVTAKATVNEPGLLTLTVRNSAGATVRTVNLSHSGTGTYSLTWSGRDNAGHLVPAGTYKLVVTAQDGALNRRSSSAVSVSVSLKKLVGTVVSKVVTPAATKTLLVVGGCSEIRADSQWSGGYDYLSDYYCYDPYDDTADVVGSDHQYTLPAAVKYAGLSVTATGQAALAGYPDVAYAWYRDAYGDAVGGATLGTSYGTRSLGTACTSLLYNGRTLRWTAATGANNYYVIRAFTVHYTYYVLQ
jgi:subtilisin family serine protease/flagellar hook assembly protein FlgD